MSMPFLSRASAPPALLVFLVLFWALGIHCGCSRAVMTTAEGMALPQPPADERVSYADHPSGFGDLRLPPGDGPFPVAVLLHGGCWMADFDLGYLSSLAAAITAEGYATWSIEYRRVGEDGGGWPGTFADVAAAADHVRVLARSYPLDMERVVAVGHSAGGHLALWLAARGTLASDDPLRGPDPIRLAGVVSLAGIPDLAAYNSPQGCGSLVPGLLGGDPADHPERLQRVSPIELLPLAVPQVLVSGGQDTIVPPIHARNYADAGGDDPIQTIVVDSAGHFELMTPEGPAWLELRKALQVMCEPVGHGGSSGR